MTAARGGAEAARMAGLRRLGDVAGGAWPLQPPPALLLEARENAENALGWR